MEYVGEERRGAEEERGKPLRSKNRFLREKRRKKEERESENSSGTHLEHSPIKKALLVEILRLKKGTRRRKRELKYVEFNFMHAPRVRT